MAQRREPEQPTREQLNRALFLAERFFAGSRTNDDLDAFLAGKILGPILTDYWRLRALLVRAVEVIEGSSDDGWALADAIRDALADSRVIR